MEQCTGTEILFYSGIQINDSQKMYNERCRYFYVKPDEKIHQ